MWQQLLALVSRVLAPREAALWYQGASAADYGNIGLPTATTSDRIEIPSWMRGRYCSFVAITSNCWVQFGDSSVDVVQTGQNTLSTETVVFADTIGGCVPAGGVRGWVIPLNATHMAWEADDTGHLNVEPDSEPILTARDAPTL